MCPEFRHPYFEVHCDETGARPFAECPCQTWFIARVFLVQVSKFLTTGHFKGKTLSLDTGVSQKLPNQLKTSRLQKKKLRLREA